MSEQAIFKSYSKTRTFNVKTITPKQLSKFFNIPVDNLMLQDEDKNVYSPENDKFDTLLPANKEYEVIYVNVSKDGSQDITQPFLNLIPSENEKLVIIQKTAGESTIKALIQPTMNLSKLAEVCAFIEYLHISAATAPDYSLVSSKVPIFNYLKNPESIKVSITQIAQKFKNLIMKNESEMHFMNAKMGFVSGAFKYILPAIWTKNNDMLIRKADLMRDASAACVTTSENCVKRCKKLIKTVQEFVKALTGVKGVTEIETATIQKTLKELEAEIDLVEASYNRRMNEFQEQERLLNNVYIKEQEQQNREAGMFKHIGAGFADLFTLGFAGARKGMDTAYEHASAKTMEEKTALAKLRQELREVETKKTDVKMKQEKYKIMSEGLNGIVESIGEAIQQIGILSDTVFNMQRYFTRVNTLIEAFLKGYTYQFDAYAKKEKIDNVEKVEMVESVVYVYLIFSAVQNSAEIFSDVVSHESIQEPINRATSHLGLTCEQAEQKKREWTNVEKSVIDKINGEIKAKLEKQAREVNENINSFIDGSIKIANGVEN